MILRSGQERYVVEKSRLYSRSVYERHVGSNRHVKAQRSDQERNVGSNRHVKAQRSVFYVIKKRK